VETKPIGSLTERQRLILAESLKAGVDAPISREMAFAVA
jgi:hypothetical protein